MTIALGILANGVVLAADAEVGVDYLKMSRGKILWVSKSGAHGHSGTIAVTGSGNSSYLDHVQKDLRGLIKNDEETPSRDQFEGIAKEYIESFYSKHILPFAAYGSERPDIQLIMACSDRQGTSLWATEHNVLTKHEHYVAVGAGEMYARILLNQLFLPMWPLNMKTAVLLAAYVIFHVKASVPGCGKETDIVCVTSSEGLRIVDRKVVESLETLFEEAQFVQADLLLQIFNEKPRRRTTLGKLQKEMIRLLSAQQIH